jgi:trans-aconitate 2-methyltransferase
MAITRDWDGASYDRISGPMEQLGREVLARLPLHGDETVLDAGCGTGRITAALLDRLPRGRVIAVDGSPAMLDAARARLGDDPRVQLLRADLADLQLDGVRCDAVLSTATFHWIPDHARLARALCGVLRPGGRLVAQCGGVGNIASVHAAAAEVAGSRPFASHLADWSGPWIFRSPAAMARDLTAAGFIDVDCRLVPRPVVPDDPVEWFRTIVLGSHVEQLPDALREPYVRAVVDRMAHPVTVDYVRLDVDAVAGRP